MTLLVDRGWSATRDFAAPARASRDGVTVEPILETSRVLRTADHDEAWAAFCSETGIAGVDLGRALLGEPEDADAPGFDLRSLEDPLRRLRVASGGRPAEVTRFRTPRERTPAVDRRRVGIILGAFLVVAAGAVAVYQFLILKPEEEALPPASRQIPPGFAEPRARFESAWDRTGLEPLRECFANADDPAAWNRLRRWFRANGLHETRPPLELLGTVDADAHADYAIPKGKLVVKWRHARGVWRVNSIRLQ